MFGPKICWHLSKRTETNNFDHGDHLQMFYDCHLKRRWEYFDQLWYREYFREHQTEFSPRFLGEQRGGRGRSSSQIETFIQNWNGFNSHGKHGAILEWIDAQRFWEYA